MKIFMFIRRQIVLLVVLCSFVLFGSQPAPAQVAVAKTDPGMNNPPPAGAVLDLSGTPIPGGGNGIYQHYTVDFNATLTSTAITLAFRDDPAQVSVANVSVVDLANPSVNLLINGDFHQGPVGSNTPTGWTYANQYGAIAGGGVASGSALCYTSAFCWLDGAVQAYDAISQTIATTIGDTYQIGFDVAEDSATFAVPGNPLFPPTYPGSDCYLAAHGGPSPCKFSNISINGDTTTPAGNGINVTAYAQAGLPAAGTQITYTFTGTGTGHLNAVAFTNATFSIVATADPNNIISNCVNMSGIFCLTNSSVTIAIQGFPTATLTTPTQVFDNQTTNTPSGVPTLGFERAPNGLNLMDLPDPAFATYNLATSTGPIVVAAPFAVGQFNCNSGCISTDQGNVDFTSISNVTFTASTATQTQTSPPQTFSSSGNTSVTVPFIFNQNQGTYDEQDEIFTQNGNLTCPIGCDHIEVQNTATPISNDPVWSTFVGGTPFGPSKLFPHASNGGTDIGTMYTIECFNNANPPRPGQCPFPTNPGPGNHVNAKEIFDLPVGVPPAIAFGTTVGGLHYPPGLNTMPLPLWSSSNMLPNPACKNVLTATFDCPLENTAVTKYGKANKIDRDTKNGSYAVAYGVPMLCSAWKVNGVPVNIKPCAQNPSNSTFFVRSPLTFDFLVTPAQLPAGFTIEQIANIQRTGGNTVTVTIMSALPAAWTNGTTLAIKPDDTAKFPPISAVISNVIGTTFQYTQAGSNVTDNPATGTVDDANGFVAAPVDKLFYHIDACTSNSGDPCSSAPDYPNVVLLNNEENLNDLDNCPGPVTDQFGNPCVVAGTSQAQPGTSSTKTVEFTTTVPVSATSLPEGLYKLQVSAKDTVNTSEMNIQLLTDPAAHCPDPSPTDGNRPMGGWTPPCYSTTLFYAKIGVDNTPPTVTNLTLTPNTQIPGKTFIASYTCADNSNASVALNSGLASCGTNLNLNLGAEPGPLGPLQLSDTPFTVPQVNGPQVYSVTATDVAGNMFTANANYFAGYQFFGFFSPVSNPGGSIPPVINVIKAGRTVPVKWQVLDGNGVGVTGLLLGLSNGGTAAGTVHLTAVNSNVCTHDTMDNNIVVDAAGNSGLQDLGGGNYQFNWKTVLPSGACVLLTVDPGDGTQHPAYFYAK